MCVLCICNICEYEKIKGGFNFFTSELHQGGESNCSECYKQFKKKNNLTKHLESFIKCDLGDGKDLWHATFVNYDGEQLINKSPLHLVDLKI